MKNCLSLPVLVLIGLFIVSACKKDPVNEPETSKRPNVLFIIADDMGVDATPNYTIGTIKPNMPHLNALMTEGITFDNFSVYPTCSPTRASILTGKDGLRNGVLKVGDNLSTNHTLLQEYIAVNTNNAYSTALVGKWHLSNDAMQPITMGVDYFAGITGGSVQDYFNWSLVENGTSSNSNEYVTSKLSDLAIDWIAQQEKPWFMWLAYNAAHTPFHLPPDTLHSQGALPIDQASIDANPLPYYMAMLEAMDHEMGRVINSLSQQERENTLIIFIGDNGTPGQVAQEYSRTRSKSSMYQGGINTPMVVSGKLLSYSGREEALVQSTDLYATISAIAGVEVQEVNDSKNFSHLLFNTSGTSREYCYVEHERDTSTDWMVRNKTHKFIHFEDGSEAFFSLENNPLEKPNLFNANQLPLSENDSIQLSLLKGYATNVK